MKKETSTLFHLGLGYGNAEVGKGLKCTGGGQITNRFDCLASIYSV